MTCIIKKNMDVITARVDDSGNVNVNGQVFMLKFWYPLMQVRIWLNDKSEIIAMSHKHIRLIWKNTHQLNWNM